MVKAGFARKHGVDPATLRVELGDDYESVGGRGYFVSLVEHAVTDVPSFKLAANRVMAAFERRQMLSISQAIRDAAVDPATPTHQVRWLATRRIRDATPEDIGAVTEFTQSYDNGSDK